MVDTHHQSRSRPGLLTYRFELASASGAGATTASRRSLASRAIEMIPRLWCPFPPQIAFAACSLDWRQSPSKILSKVVWLYRVLIKTLFSAPPRGAGNTNTVFRKSFCRQKAKIDIADRKQLALAHVYLCNRSGRACWLIESSSRTQSRPSDTHTHTQR